jgi:hypothetical protein
MIFVISIKFDLSNTKISTYADIKGADKSEFIESIPSAA